MITDYFKHEFLLYNAPNSFNIILLLYLSRMHLLNFVHRWHRIRVYYLQFLKILVLFREESEFGNDAAGNKQFA